MDSIESALWTRELEIKVNQLEKMYEVIRNMSLRSFNNMMDAYRKYLLSATFLSPTRTLVKLADHELAAIPKEMLVALMSTDIDRVWNRLPTRVREDPVVHGYKRCLEHICLYGGWPGPAPIRLRCEVCQRKAALEERL